MEFQTDIKTHIFETNNPFIVYTIGAWALAIFVHYWAQTAGFTSGYFTPPNYYNMPATARVDQITHALSTHAAQCTILNFNLPGRFKVKWAVALSMGVLVGIGWEGMEYLTAPLWGWMTIAAMDTYLDLFQDGMGALAAIGLYIIIMMWSDERTWRKYRKQLQNQCSSKWIGPIRQATWPNKLLFPAKILSKTEDTRGIK